MPQLNITEGAYTSRSLPISHQQCINWYPSKEHEEALSNTVLFGTPGIIQLASSGIVDQGNRGAWVKNGVPYFVNGSTLYALIRLVDEDANETFSLLALGIIAGSGRVWMADNSGQLMILAPNTAAYIYDENAATPFQEITDSDFYASGNPQTVIFVDGYFLCTTDEKRIITSAINDGLSWDALDFGTAESDPDAVVAAALISNQVFILGVTTTEGFQNSGASGFPFVRNNIFLDKGCAAAFSVVTSNAGYFMVGSGKNESPAIWYTTGTSYQKISSPPIDSLLLQLSQEELSQCFGFSYAQNGAYFVGWTFGQYTMVYDLVSEKWHERKSYREILEDQVPWRVTSIVRAYNHMLVDDIEDGRIGKLSLDEYQEYDNDITRIVTSKPFSNDGDSLVVPVLELTMESGVGNDDVPDPVVGLAMSKDAKTFNYERIRKIGKKGEFFRRAVWRKNGRFPRYCILRFRLSDPVKPVIIKLEAK